MKRALALLAIPIILAACGGGGGDNLSAGIARYNKANPSHFSKARLVKIDKALRDTCAISDQAMVFYVAQARDKHNAAAETATGMVCPSKMAKAQKAVDAAG